LMAPSPYSASFAGMDSTRTWLLMLALKQLAASRG